MSRYDDVIFLIKGRTGHEETELERMPSQQYEDEDLLQSLLDDHPEILAGEQIEPDDPIRWFLVTREAGIPDSDTSGNRWAVDHLLLDQHGRPTLVEDKRSSDPRLRREVVGQMLDYAANAQLYWPVDRIRTLAAERHGGSDALDEALLEFLSPDAAEDAASEIEAYWQQVDDNLRSGNVRLLFVADQLPRELRRVIEFLNAQMPNVEVLGVEIRQYVAEEVRVLVPRLFGQTEGTRRGKRSRTRGVPLDSSKFLDLMPSEVCGFFRQLLADAERHGLICEFTERGSSLRIPHPHREPRAVLYMYPPGEQAGADPHLQVYLAFLSQLGEDVSSIRGRLMDAAPFRESGKHTLRLDVTLESLEEAKTAVERVFEIADEVRRRWMT